MTLKTSVNFKINHVNYVEHEVRNLEELSIRNNSLTMQSVGVNLNLNRKKLTKIFGKKMCVETYDQTYHIWSFTQRNITIFLLVSENQTYWQFLDTKINKCKLLKFELILREHIKNRLTY